MGIDQGGTKTEVVVSDMYGNILGYGKSRGAYHHKDGVATATAAVREASDMAMSKLEIYSRDIGLLVAGMTGMDWPEDYPILKSVLFDATGVHNIKIYNDSIIAMYGGTTKTSGIVMCAGTGLNVAVKGPRGDEAVLGDYIRAEDQGGSALARRAIQLVFLSDIRLCSSTKLTQLFCNYARNNTVDELLYLYSTDEEFRSNIRYLIPQIIDISRHDEVANKLIVEFAKDISQYVYAGLNKYNMLGIDTDVVLSGSVLKGKNNLLTEKISECVKIFAPNTSIINAKYEPVVGAYIRALMTLDNFESDKKTILHNLHESAISYILTRDL